MSRRWPAVLVALSTVLALAGLGRCKPPDLPRYQNVVVAPQEAELLAEFALARAFGGDDCPLQVLFSDEFIDGPCGEEVREANAPRCARSAAEPASVKKPTAEAAPVKLKLFEDVRSVRQAAFSLRKARRLARMGLHDEALAFLDKARAALGADCPKEIRKEIEADCAHVRAVAEEHKRALVARKEPAPQPVKKPAEPEAKIEATVPQPAKVICQGGACGEGYKGCCPPASRYEIVLQTGGGCPWMGNAFGWLKARQSCAAEVALKGAPSCQEASCGPKACCPVAMCFREVPLVCALEKIREVAGCRLCFDPDAAMKAGVSPIQPVTVKVEGLPLHGALEVILRPHGLRATVKGEVIEVTCAAECRTSAQSQPSRVAQGECPKCEVLHAQAVKAKLARDAAAKQVMFSALMKACRLAIEGRRFEKAAELAHQAHALDADAVECDPLVIRLDLLRDCKAAVKGRSLTGAAGRATGGEEASEVPGTPAKLVPHVPGVFGDVVEGIEAAGKPKPGGR